MLADLSNGTSLHLCFTLFVIVMLLRFLGCYLYKLYYLLYGLFYILKILFDTFCIFIPPVSVHTSDVYHHYGSREGSTTSILIQFAMEVQNGSLQLKSAKFEMEA